MVTVLVAVNVAVFVDTTNTAPTHFTADWYLGGEKTGLPFWNMHNVVPARAWSGASATLLSMKLRFCAGVSPEPGNDDSIGTKPAVVPIVVAEDVTVIKCMFDEIDVSFTNLLWL